METTVLFVFCSISIIQYLSEFNCPSDIDLFPSNFYNWVQTVESFTVKSILHEAVLHGAFDWLVSKRLLLQFFLLCNKRIFILIQANGVIPG